ncbi:alpha/beta hydrolase [Patulibacter defluvii]|uniref:alpha/beta hydrolase n=1 Tax=Patulibacter defluvii TaxID=3095358 RepID=UPI002A76528F|nr:alpha/beta fold hydrolase [Patulibacter sp. DM4]
MRRVVSLLLLALLVPLAGAGGASAAPKLRPCPKQPGFGCGTLTVPLDRSGRTPGTIGLRFAIQDSRAARRKPRLLAALSGGPGQAGAPFAASFARSLKPLLSRYRLVTLDQRGTGRSGVLSCPELQRLLPLTEASSAQAAACAAQVGAQRPFFSTRDSVADLDALRAAFGSRKLALMGVSYGTFVAQQYARIHPATTDRLVLDSVVPAVAGSPFAVDLFQAIPRVVREICGGSRCRGVTRDPLDDVAALLAKLRAAPLQGPVHDSRGRRRTVTLSAPEVPGLLFAGDLNGPLRAALPAAVRGALAGDPAPLLRLRSIAAGAPSKTRELSFALYQTTTCLDQALPYALTDAPARRRALADAAFAKIPAADYAPFAPGEVLPNSNAITCIEWPADRVERPSTAPLPDVPALILNGRLDMRTGVEGAREVAAELPHSSLVAVAGTGHDVLDSDASGCAERALKRFAAGRAVGQPCRGHDNHERIVALAPRRLSAVRPIRGTSGDRSRVANAALLTVGDAIDADNQRLFSGLPERGGGLRGGRFRADANSITLSRYAYVPRVRVSGRIRFGDRGAHGTLRVDGPGRLDGRLTLDGRGRATATIGGGRIAIRLG